MRCILMDCSNKLCWLQLMFWFKVVQEQCCVTSKVHIHCLPETASQFCLGTKVPQDKEMRHLLKMVKKNNEKLAVLCIMDHL